MPPTSIDRRRALGAAASVAGSALLTACAAPATPPPPLLRLQGPGVLFGEVHDNAAGHALRLAALDDWLARGARPAVAMEMFDRSDQPVIDRLRASSPPAVGEARAFVDAVLAARPPGAPQGGWDWRFYVPFVDRALRQGLPLVAANVGRGEARVLMREGLAAHGFDAEVPADVLAAHARDIEASHCGQVDAALAQRMAVIQIARDQQMARAVEAHIDRGVLLLAGNGHVRRDVGVPRWLRPATRLRCEVIGVLETGDELPAYDRIVRVPAAPREDPCLAMRTAPRPG